jgi:hypothetical protein
MESASALIRKNLAYAFVVFGLIWLGIALLAGSALILWPAVACGVGGVLLKLRPSSRLAAAWAPAAALLGLLLCAYQVYAAVPLLSGAFITIASTSTSLFVILGLGHVYLAYASYSSGPVK